MQLVANFGTDDFSGKTINSVIWQEFMNYTYLATDYRLSEIWNNFYGAINQASDIIKNVPSSPFQQASKDRIVAEAKFMRALYYFNLVRMFGKVPLIIEPTSSLDNLNHARNSTQEVFAQIILDLNEAAAVLPAASATPAGKATRGAALALLSKAYLFMGSYGKYKSVSGYDWVDVNQAFANSVNFGKQVLALPEYSLASSYPSIFQVETENNSEIIFSVQFEGSSSISGQGGFTVNNFGPAFVADAKTGSSLNNSRGGQANARPTKNLIARYATTDSRLAWNVAKVGYNVCTEVTTTVSYAGKFRKPCGFNGQHFSDPVNFPLLRLADIMLVVAEADAELNNGVATALGLQLVTQLRTKRYAPNVPGAITGNFLDFIFDERSRELCYEGQRWFDLQRTGRLINAVKSATLSIGTTSAPANIQPKHYLFPIPQNEIDNNSLISNT
ncbi:MAG: RagB/SusD family nutrient uptake outer membrane protein, partial [Pedobacter sp.]